MNRKSFLSSLLGIAGLSAVKKEEFNVSYSNGVKNEYARFIDIYPNPVLSDEEVAEYAKIRLEDFREFEAWGTQSISKPMKGLRLTKHKSGRVLAQWENPEDKGWTTGFILNLNSKYLT